MNKSIWKRIIDVAITVLTAIAAAITATSCTQGTPFDLTGTPFDLTCL